MEIPGYKVGKELGRGGMATVYLAVQSSFDRKVAVKVLDAEAASDHDLASRFIREAKIVAQLSHPHIVSVYDVGQQNNLFFMSMDYLAGGSLPERIEQGIEKADVIRIVSQIASALSCLHDNGYIHRDIKPDNIMFRADNSAVLTDFGVARSQNAGEGLTQVGTIIGTPVYMSPEQINGHQSDARADIYALGIVLYEMLMGEPPYLSEDFLAVAVKHLQDPIPDLTLEFEEFQDILEKCLAKKPEDRFQSAQDIVKALDELSKPVMGQKQASSSVTSVSTASVDSLDSTLNDDFKQPRPVTEERKPTPKIQKRAEGLNFDETLRKKLGLMKRYTLIVDLTVSDAQTFSILFSRVTTKLVDWHDERADKSEAINFVLYIPDWLFKKAKTTIQQIVNSDGTYEFLQHLTLTVALHDIEGEKIDAYICKRTDSK